VASLFVKNFEDPERTFHSASLNISLHCRTFNPLLSPVSFSVSRGFDPVSAHIKLAPAANYYEIDGGVSFDELLLKDSLMNLH